MWERCDACSDGSTSLPPEPLPVIEILTARDDRLQKQEDKRFTAERHRVTETGLRFLHLLFIYYAQWKELGKRERVKQRGRDGKSKD